MVQELCVALKTGQGPHVCRCWLVWFLMMGVVSVRWWILVVHARKSCDLVLHGDGGLAKSLKMQPDGSA